MAGSQDPSDNPVAINVVPMVDVIFCLCVFFMCSMKFKEMEGKFDSWLPKDKGQQQSADMPQIEEIRVMMVYDEAARQLTRRFGRTEIQNDVQLLGLIKDAYADRLRIGHPETPCIIDAGETVPWKDVVNVMNLAKIAEINKIEFAAGKNYEAPPAPKKQ
jgi:biopolymer transport protein ExbD